MVPVVWNDVVWALPATTCLPELWAARSISFNLAFSIPSIWFSFISLSKRANGFSSSSHCSFLPDVSSLGSRTSHEHWQKFTYNKNYCPNSSASSIFKGAVGRVCGMRLCGCCSQYTQSTGWEMEAFKIPIFPLLLGKQATSPALVLASCDWITQSMWRLLSVLHLSSLSPSSYKPKMTQFGVSFFWAMNLQKLFSFSWQWLSPREIK